MRCDHARALLQDHLERLLLPLDRAAVDEHLARCPECAAEAAHLARITDALAALPDPAVPDAFTEAVMARLPEMLPAEHGAGHVLRWGAAAAALVFAFLASLSLLIQGGGPDVARGTLEPLGASVELAAVMLAGTASALAALLDASASAIAAAPLPAKLAFAIVLVAANGALLALVAATRPQLADAHAGARAVRRRP